MPGANGLDSVPTTDDVRKSLHLPASVNGKLVGQASQASSEMSFFHWPLEFPDVFDEGGFDVLLGNPPWDQVQPEEVKFFGVWEPSIAALAGARRKAAIDKLPETDPQLGKLWDSHKRSIEGLSKFGRASGRFKLTAVGKINKYSIFAETARTICGPEGRGGMIVPSGIATDDTTKQFFSDLVDNHSLVSLYDFENRERVFPGIDSRIKFCLLTFTGADRPSDQGRFAFFLHRTEQLQEEARQFTLTPEDFALFNPNTRTCPVFRTQRDADIVSRMYRLAGVLWKEAGQKEPESNPWGVSFSQMFNMTTDSQLFRTREQLLDAGYNLDGNIFTQGADRYLPLYEAKLFHQYDHRFATFDDVDERSIKGGNARNMTPDEKSGPGTVPIPRYWIPEKEVAKKLGKSENDNNTLKPASQPIASRFDSSPEERIPGRRSAPSYQATGWGTRERLSESGLEPSLAPYHHGNQPANYYSGFGSANSPWAQRCHYHTSTQSTWC